MSQLRGKPQLNICSAKRVLFSTRAQMLSAVVSYAALKWPSLAEHYEEAAQILYQLEFKKTCTLIN